MHKNWNVAFKAAVAGWVLTAVSASADPQVTVQHPPSVTLMGGQTTRTVDCATLVRFPQRPKELWATCAFAQQVDSNGQKICSVTDNMPAGEREQKNALSTALYQSLIHFARVHHDCVAQAGAVDARLGRNPDTIYGPGWQSKTSCTLIQARDQCSAAMGLE